MTHPAIARAYKRYRHLDALLVQAGREPGVNDFAASVLADLWRAIKEAAMAMNDYDALQTLVTVADRDLDRLDTEQAKLRWALERLAEISAEKIKVLEAQLVALQTMRRLLVDIADPGAVG